MPCISHKIFLCCNFLRRYHDKARYTAPIVLSASAYPYVEWVNHQWPVYMYMSLCTSSCSLSEICVGIHARIVTLGVRLARAQMRLSPVALLDSP